MKVKSILLLSFSYLLLSCGSTSTQTTTANPHATPHIEMHQELMDETTSKTTENNEFDEFKGLQNILIKNKKKVLIFMLLEMNRFGV